MAKEAAPAAPQTGRFVAERFLFAARFTRAIVKPSVNSEPCSAIESTQCRRNFARVCVGDMRAYGRSIRTVLT
jgi:hypothetical protein